MARPLKTQPLARVSVVTSSEAEEPVAALVERIFGAAPSIYWDVEKQNSVVTYYGSETPSQLRNHQQELKTGLEVLRKLGLDTGSGEMLFEKVRKEDWSESWKKHFKTIVLGSALIIKPSWSKQKSKPGQKVVTLDPGLSFGTGQHATTSFCLKQIVALRPKDKTKGVRSMLDIGSGSGILAISAAKLGYAPVEGFDFDPVAVRIAAKNCQLNRVEKKVGMKCRDLTLMPLRGRMKYDLVCANLISNLLLAERDKILNRVNPGGTVILAGILASEFKKVQDSFESAGFGLQKTVHEREWQSGSFRRLV